MAASAFELAATLTLDSSEFESGLGSAKSTSSTVSTAIGTFIGNMVTSAVTKFAEFASAALEAGKAYETGFAKIKTLTNGTTVDMDAMSDAILALSSTTGTAATEIEEAVYQAISGGVDAEAAVEAVNVALQLAKGGFTDTATAVDILTTATNAYNGEAGTMEQIADKLITTQNKGKTTVAELAANMGRVIPTAAAYGVSIDNLCASYAILTASGVNTAIATTDLNAMFNELGDSGSTVSKVLKEKTGKSFKELMKEGKSLGDVMQILMDSVDGDVGAFNELWSSTTAGQAALILAQAGVEKFSDTLAAMMDSTGATASAYAEMSNTISNKTAVISNMFTVFGQKLFNRVAPYLSQALDAIREPLATLLTNVENGIGNAIDAAATFITNIGAAIQGDKGAIETINGIFDGIFGKDSFLSGLFSEIVRVGGAMITDIGAILSGDVSAAEGIKTLFGDIFGEDSVVTGFINSLVDTGSKILEHIHSGLTGDETPSTAIKGVFAALFGEESGITKILNSVIDTGSGIIGAIKKGIEDDQPLGAIISNVFKEIFGSDGEGGATGVLGIIGGVRDAGSGLISSIAEALGVEGVGDAIVGVFEGIFGKAGEGGAGGTGIIGLISNVATTGGNLLTAIETALSGEDPGKGIKDIFKAVFGDGSAEGGGIAGIIKTVGDTGGDLFSTIAGKLGASEETQSQIREAFSGLFGAHGIGKIISDVADAGGSLFSKIYGFLDGEMSFTELIDGMFDALFGETGIGQIISDLAGMGGSLFSTIFGGLNDDTDNQSSIEQIFNTIFGAAGTIAGLITEGVIALGSNIIAKIYSELTGKDTDAADVRDWVKTNVIDPIVEFWNGIVSTAGAIWEGIKGAFNDAIAVVNEIVTWVDTNIVTPISSLFSGIVTVIDSIIQGLKDFLGYDGSNIKTSTTHTTYEVVVQGSGVHESTGGESHGGGGRQFAVGNDYIPYDNYPATLHKGERVLTALENQQYMRDSKLTEYSLRGNAQEIDYNALGEAVANALAGLSINMDSRQVGQLVAPTVSQSIMQTANMRRY